MKGMEWPLRRRSMSSSAVQRPGTFVHSRNPHLTEWIIVLSYPRLVSFRKQRRGPFWILLINSLPVNC